MWVVVHMVHTMQRARQAQQCLADEGILCRVRAVYKGVAEQENYYEIRVLQVEASEAQSILMEHDLLADLP